ncbi:MAG TPA: hypothetical protein VJV79_16795 [Polyangiaceae bacterium]|nr:hypothetical protein [Polyangiaceae bacterium]
MKHTALLLTLLASLPLGACSMAPLDTEAGSEEQTDSTSAPLMWWVSDPAPTLIDFDLTPAQAAIADGTIVDTTYTSLGVTFTCIVCSSGHAFARATGRTGNGVSMLASPLFAAYDSHMGAVRAEFTSPRSWVSVDTVPIIASELYSAPSARPWLEAFNAAGLKIGSTVYYPAYGTPGYGQWQTLRIDDPTGSIKSVRLSSQHGAPMVYAKFDNLSFNTDPYWVEAYPVQRPPPIFRGTLGPAPATAVKR